MPPYLARGKPAFKQEIFAQHYSRRRVDIQHLLDLMFWVPKQVLYWDNPDTEAAPYTHAISGRDVKPLWTWNTRVQLPSMSVRLLLRASPGASEGKRGPSLALQAWVAYRIDQVNNAEALSSVSRISGPILAESKWTAITPAPRANTGWACLLRVSLRLERCRQQVPPGSLDAAYARFVQETAHKAVASAK